MYMIIYKGSASRFFIYKLKFLIINVDKGCIEDI